MIVRPDNLPNPETNSVRRWPRSLQDAFGENTSLEVLPMPEPPRQPINPPRLLRTIGQAGRRIVVLIAGH